MAYNDEMDFGNYTYGEGDETFTADCPHCDRGEEFDDVHTSNAWIVAHIQESHSDELPAFDK